MFAEEWPLMMFTLFSQLAVGILIVFICIDLFKGKQATHHEHSKVMNNGLVVVWPLMGFALVFSLFHLGTPMGAYRAVINFTSSWLSREIIFAGLFFVLAIVTYFLFKKGKKYKILGMVTAIVGLLVIYSMASIYGSSIRPAWANSHTYVVFFGTTCLLGCISAAVIIAMSVKGQGITPSVISILKKISIVALIAIVVQLGYLPFFLSNLGNGGLEAQASQQLFTGDYSFVLGIKWVLSSLGILLLLHVAYKYAKNSAVFNGNILFVALILIFAGEFIGRYVFYATAVSIGIG